MASRDGCLNFEYVADVAECKDDGVGATQVMLIANHNCANAEKFAQHAADEGAEKEQPRTRTRGVDAAEHAFPADALPQADSGGGVKELASSPAASTLSRTTSGPGRASAPILG